MLSRIVTGTARAQVEARVLDLSLGGALLHLATALEVGAISDFCLPLEGGSVSVQAEVRRCTPAGDGYEVGLEFVGMHPHDQRRLREYLDRPR
jgi:c-di-GMP-binding flagellar brake protein YcgR